MKYIILIAFYCLAICGCKKERERMPEATQSGKNILACKVNGKVHIYEGKRSYLNSNGVTAQRYMSGTEILIRVHADKREDYDDNIEMEIVADQPDINKEYIFSKEDSKDRAEYYVGQSNENKYYTKSSSGYIKFTRFDKAVAAGVFMFTAYRDNGDKVEITEGFFDITLKD